MLGDKDRLIELLEQENKYLKTLVDRLLEGKGLTPVDIADRPAGEVEASILENEAGAEIIGGD